MVTFIVKYIAMIAKFRIITFMLFLTSSLVSQSISDYGATVANITYNTIADESPSFFTWPVSTLEDDDYLSNTTGIGFNFTYNGQIYTQFKASVNGFITFNTAANPIYEDASNGIMGSYSNNPFQFYESSGSLNIIAPFYTDLLLSNYIQGSNADVNSTVAYKLAGSAPNRILTVEWKDCLYGNGGIANFQVKLYEVDSKIDFIYGNTNVLPQTFDNKITVPITGINGTTIQTSYQPQPAELLNVSSDDPIELSHSLSQIRTEIPDTNLRIRFSLIANSCNVNSNASNLNFPVINHTNVEGRFNKSAHPFVRYYIIRKNNGITPVYNYNSDSSAFIFNGTLVYDGPDTTFTDDELLDNTTYHYWVFTSRSYNCSGSKPILSTPITNSITTLNCLGVPSIIPIGPTGTYPTLTAAINNLETVGLGGSVTLELQPAYDPNLETYPIEITDDIPCLSESNQILIRPMATVVTTKVLQASNTTSVLRIQNANYVTIDGRPGSTGSNKYLTFKNTNTSGAAIELFGNSKFNTIRYCNLYSINDVSYEATVVFDNLCSSCFNKGLRNNLIEYCNINELNSTSENAIYSSGGYLINHPNFSNIDNTIQFCNIRNYFTSDYNSNGIYLYNGNSHWTIYRNSFYQDLTRNYTGFFGNLRDIYIYSGSGYNIKGNHFGGNNINAGGGKMIINGEIDYCTIEILQTVKEDIVGNSLNITEYDTTRIDSNIVKNMKFNNCENVSLLNLKYGSYNIGVEDGNKFGGLTSSDSINVINAQNVFETSIFQLSDCKNINFNNNSVYNLNINYNNPFNYYSILLINKSYQYGLAGNLRLNISNNTFGSLDGIRTIKFYDTRYSSIIKCGVGFVGTIFNNDINYIKIGIDIYSYGILSGSSDENVFFNTISNIVSNNEIVGISAAGIIKRNTISNLLSTSSDPTADIIGIFSEYSPEISANHIFNFAIPNFTSVDNSLYGIYAENAVISNNSVVLGVNITAGLRIYGIGVTSGKLFNNSVYIAGSCNSIYSSWGVLLFGTQIEFKNNIIVNVRSNAGTGMNYILYQDFGFYSPVGIDHNLYYHFGLNTEFFSTPFTSGDFYIWKYYGYDRHSGFFAPNFVNPSAYNLHLLSPTPAESLGKPVEEVDIDIDLQARDIIIPDAGIDEGNFTSIDVLVPDVDYTLLPTQCGASDRTLIALIKDSTGVYTTGAKRPRIYYKKNNGTYFNRVGTLQSGDGKYGMWSFTIVAADMGGLSNNDDVEYFIVALDTSPQDNLSSEPHGAEGTETNNLMTYPVSPNEYTINTLPIISGTYDIGVGQTFNNIGAAFDAYNNGCIADNITFLLKDSIYNITTDTLKYNKTASESGTLKILPTKLNTVINGNSSGATLVMQGAQYITIDGSFFGIVYDECSEIQGNRNLTIKNNNSNTSSVVIKFTDVGNNKSYRNCSIRNCFIYGNNNQTKTGVYLEETFTDNNSTNTILFNNGIGGCQTGIEAAGASISNILRLDIINNDMNYAAPNNIKQFGIVLNHVQNAKVFGNKIDRIKRTDNKTVGGIIAGFDPTVTIINSTSGNVNSIRDIEISNNIIDTISQAGTFSAIGIALSETSNDCVNLISNNMISHVSANCTNNRVAAGIFCSSSLDFAVTRIFNNTVHMQGIVTGATAGTGYSTCFGYNDDNNEAKLKVKNNIFVNTQNGNASSTMKFTSIGYYPTDFPSSFFSDQNDLYSAGTGPGTYALATTGGFGTGTLIATLSAWQTVSDNDTSSYNFLPLFEGHNNLRLQGVPANASLDGNADRLNTVVTDIDCEIRDYATPDIGADEFISCRINLATNIAGYHGQSLTSIQDISSSNTFYYECEPMATVIPAGPIPVYGNVETKLTLSDTALFYGVRPLGRRYFDIEPSLLPNFSTALVVLYFNQSDFDNYNLSNGDYLELPVNKFDSIGIKNIRILQMHGKSTSGDPNDYSGQTVELDPAKIAIQWNSKLQAWAIAFNVYGFSGFYLTSAAPICRTSNIKFVSNIAGSTYKWQVNTGSGYNDLTNGGVYSGVNSDTITIASPPTSYRGYKYRCVVNNTFNGQENELLFSLKWNGNANVNWANVNNWGCSSVPDIYTDVLIDSGTPFSPQVNVNAFARTLKLTPGVTLQVNNPRTLRVEQP